MHCIPLASLLQKRTLLDYSQPLLPPSLSPWSDPPGWRSPGTAARRTERTGGSRSRPPVRPGRIKSRGRPAWGHPSSETERGQVRSGQGEGGGSHHRRGRKYGGSGGGGGGEGGTGRLELTRPGVGRQTGSQAGAGGQLSAGSSSSCPTSSSARQPGSTSAVTRTEIKQISTSAQQ